MKKKLSDKDLDQLMQTLVCDAGADDKTVSEIADSPTLWWAVQRQINTRNDAAPSPWPPASILRRWLMIGVPVAAAVLLTISLFVVRPVDNANTNTVIAEGPNETKESAPAVIEKTSGTNDPVVITNPSGQSRSFVAAKRSKDRPTIKTKGRSEISRSKTPEIRSEFIALSYARNPESGQIVRVKVPSSMMVTLGLVASVERPTSLVNADVIVGDDGTTHAIRFIR